MASQFANAARVAVIGGGITGLAAAWRIGELAASAELPVETTLFESGPRVGGALETISQDGYLIETGADSILTEKPSALKLAERLGLQGEIIGTQQQLRRTYVVRGGRLLPIPDGFALMAPTFLGPVMRSEIFSPLGKLRLLAEPLIPRRRSGQDETLAHFVRRRLGREVLDRLVQPLAGGIYTGDPRILSMAATMPRFVELERRYGSLIRGLKAAARTRPGIGRGESGARWSLFVSFRQGLAELTDKLALRLGSSIRCGVRVVALERQQPSERPRRRPWRLRLEDALSFDADAIICAIPAFAAAPLVRPHDEELAEMLSEIEYASTVTVNLAFRETDFVKAPSGFGFVVPALERRRIIAASFSSLKYQGRAPAGTVLVRTFLGGALHQDIVALDDAHLVTAAREELSALAGAKGNPLLTCVRRWPRSMPQYAVGHLERAPKMERRAAGIGNFALAGAFLHGVGIPDCVRGGEEAAEMVFSRLMISRDTA